MRTVSFSPARVRNKLQDNFISWVINTEGDPSAGSSRAHSPRDPTGTCSNGIGQQNVQTLFLTPEGEIFHTASGFQSAEKLIAEMDTATDLWNRIRHDRENARAIVRDAHLARLQQLNNTKDADLGRNPLSTAVNRSQQRSSLPRQFRPTEILSAMQNAQSMADRIFVGKTRQSAYDDARFGSQYPMLPIEEFQKSPNLLVGNAVSSFVSGNASGGRIGGNARPNQQSNSSR